MAADEIISTLLVNAIEACSEGSHIALRSRNASNLRNPGVRGVRIMVADSGIGIPAKNIAHIFELTKGEQGTGIGL